MQYLVQIKYHIRNNTISAREQLEVEKITYYDQIKKDLKLLKIGNWKSVVQDREKWKVVAKTNRNLSGHACTDADIS